MKNYNFEAVAELAKLSFDLNEKELFERDFVDMISFADVLSAEYTGEQTCCTCPLYDDIPDGNICSTRELLDNAPKLSGDYILVPKVL